MDSVSGTRPTRVHVVLNNPCPVPGKLSQTHRQDREATSRNAHQYNPDDVQLTGELNIVKPAAYVDGRLLCVQGHTD